MPDISTFKSPVNRGEFARPKNYHYGDRVGSKDTWIGRAVGGNYYDKGLLDYEQQADLRYQNQGYLNAIGNFAGDLGVKTLAGVPSILGSLVGVGKGIGSAATGGSFAKGFDDNALLDVADSISAWGAENFPLLQSEGFSDKSFLEKITPGNWGQLATSNVETLAMLTQGYGVAGLLGKVGAGTRVVNKLAKGSSFKDVLINANPNNLAKIAGTLDEIAINTFLTTNEAALEGVDAKEQVISKLTTDRDKGLNTYSDAEIEDQANKSLNNVFWLNIATTGATNSFFTKLVAPIFSPKQAATRLNNLGLELAAGDVAVKGSKKLSGFEKFLYDEGHTASVVSRSLLGQMVSEGAEEGLQYSIQKANEAYSNHESFLDSSKAFLTDVLTHGLDFSDNARLESIGLGAIIGGGQTAIASALQGGPVAQAREFREAREKALTALNKGYTDFFTTSIIEKEDDIQGKLKVRKKEDGTQEYIHTVDNKDTVVNEDDYNALVARFQPAEDGSYTVKGGFKKDAKGELQKDSVKAAKLAAAVTYHGELDNLIDLEANKETVDATKIQLLQLEKLANLSQTAFETGTTDLLLQKLDTFKGMAPEKLAEAGINDPKQVSETIENWKTHVKRLEANYLQQQNSILYPVSTKEDAEILRALRNKAASIGNRIINLQAVREQLRKELNEASANVQTPFTEAVFNGDDFSSAPGIKEADRPIAIATTKLRDVEAALEDLGKVYQKLTAPDKGFKEFKKALETRTLNKYLTPRDANKQLVLTPDTSSDTLDRFLAKRSITLKQAAKLKLARNLFFEGSLQFYEQYAQSVGVAEKIASLKQMLTKLESEELLIYPQTAKELTTYIQETLEEFNALSKAMNADAVSKFGQTADDLWDQDPDDISDAAIDFLTNEYQQVKDLEADVKLLQKAIEDKNGQTKLDSFVTFDATKLTDADFDKRAAKELLANGEKVVSASGYNGDTILEDYDDLPAVQKQLALIKLLEPLAAKSAKTEVKSLKSNIEDLIKDLERVEVLVKKNLQNKDIKNKREDAYYADATVKLLGSFATPETTALAKIDTPLAAAALNDLVSREDKAVLEGLEANLKSRLTNLIANLKVLHKPGITAGISEELTKLIVDNPSRGIARLWQFIDSREEMFSAKNNKALARFVKDYDIVKFMSGLNSLELETTPEQIKELLEIQGQFVALEQVKETAESSFNNVFFLTSVRNYLKNNPNEVLPSSAQIRVVRELVTFAMAKNSSDNSGDLFRNGAALRAPAGAGKSLVVSKLFKHVLGFKTDEIATTAPYKRAAENIASSMGGPSTSIDVLTESLEKSTINPKTKLIVVDEAGAMTIPQVNRFAAAIAQYNRTTGVKAPVKFIMLYDPNQVTPGNVGRPVLDLNFISQLPTSESAYYGGTPAVRKQYESGQIKVDTPYTTPFIHHLKQITPLSVTYRSSVSEVVDLQNTFKVTDEVTEVVTSASSVPSQSMANIYGTFAETSNNVASLYKKGQLENPNRSRVILVGNEQKRAQYIALLGEAEADNIMVVPESAGIAQDEVFIDLQPTDSQDLSSPDVFNQWMYTAASRTKAFTYITNFPKATFTVDTTIEPSKPTTTSSAEAIKTLDDNIKTLTDITKDTDKVKVEDVVKAEVTEETSTTADETTSEVDTKMDELLAERLKQEEEESDVRAEAAEEVVTTLPSDVRHQLLYPSSSVFQDRPDLGLPPIEIGQPVMLIKDNSPRKDGSPAERYVVIREVQDTAGESVFEMVAVLGDSELTSEMFSSSEVKNLSAINLTEHETFIPKIYKPSLAVASSVTFYIAPGTKDLEFVYGPNPTYSFKDALDASEDGKLKDFALLNTYLQEVWGPDPSENILNYEEVLKNPEAFVKVTVFKSSKEVLKMFPNALSLKEAPKTNVPYMVIHGLQSKTGRPINNQFIQLTPSIMSASKIEPVKTFLQTLEKFEQALAKTSLPGVYSQMKLGVPVVIGGQSYYPFHDFVVRLSKAYTAKNKGEAAYVEITSHTNLIGSFPRLEINDIPDDLLRLAFELDVWVHGQVAEGERRNYKGEAQKVLEQIGSQNLVVTAPNGTNIILRDYKHYEGATREVTDSVGISLLGPVKFERERGLAYNPLIKDPLMDRLREYARSMESRGKVTPRLTFIKNILDAKNNRHLAPLTRETLVSLFIDGEKNGLMENVSGGFGIRTPIPESFNFSKDTALSNLPLEMLESHLESISKTTIVLSRAPMSAEETPALPRARKISEMDKLKLTIENKGDISGFSEEVKTSFTSLMKAASFEEAVDKYRANNEASNLYTSSNNNLFTAIKNLIGSIEPTRARILEDVQTSVDVKDIGRNEGGIASRDFIRASVLSRIFRPKTPSQILAIADVARKDYQSGKNYSEEDFKADLLDLMQKFGTDLADMNERLEEIMDIYVQIAADNNLNVPYFDSPFSMIEAMVVVSTGLRKLAKITVSEETIVQEAAIEAITEVTPVTPTEPVVEVTTNTIGKVEDSSPAASLLAYVNKLIEFENDSDAFEQQLASNKVFKSKLAKIDEDPLEAAFKLKATIEKERSKTFLSENVGREMTEKEIEDYLRSYSMLPNSFFKFLSRSNVSKELFKILEYGKLVNSRGQTVWGLYKDGVMSYAKLASGRISSKVVRHEMFHKIFWEYLTESEQVAAINLARERFGEDTVEALEERLAENFEDFVATKRPSIFTSLWNKLLRLLGFTYNNLSSIENFYSLIENNAFSTKIKTVGSVERSALNLRAKFDNLSEFKIVKHFLLQSFSSIENSRRQGAVLSYEEILVAVRERLRTIAAQPELYAPRDYSVEQVRYISYALNKMLSTPSTWKALVETYFGQTQTRGALLKALDDERNEDIRVKTERFEEVSSMLNDELVESKENLQDEYESLKSEIDGLKAETFDSELVDPALKLTGVVKQRLVSIRYFKNGVEDYADLGAAFSIILERAASIPSSSLKESLKAIQDNFKDLASFSSTPNIRKAVGNFMLTTAKNISDKLDNPKRDKTIVFRKDANFKSVYAIYSLDGSDVTSVSLHTAKTNPTKYGYEVKGELPLSHLINTISKTNGTAYSKVADAYYLYEDIDFIRSLIVAVGSLRQNRPLSFMEKWDKGIYKVSNFLLKMGGGRNTQLANVRYKFNTYATDLLKKGSSVLFEQDLIDEIKAANSIDAKRKAISKFLKTIGINKRITDASVFSIERAHSRLALILPVFNRSFNTIANEVVKKEDVADIGSILEDENSFLEDMTDLLNSHFSLGETHSYTRGDGKKAYGWIDGSYQSEILTSIMNSFNGRASKVFSTFSVDGTRKKLVTTDRFLKDNIFFKGLSEIVSFNDYDSWKQKGNERFAKTIRKENQNHFRRRHFVGNFLGRVAATGGARYYQALPIPSNRTVVQNVEVSVLNLKSADEALTAILTAQKNRPDPAKNPDLAKVNTYTKNNNWRRWKFSGLSGAVTDLSISEAKQKVREHARTKVAEILPDFLGSATQAPKIRIPDRDFNIAVSKLLKESANNWKTSMSEEEKQRYWDKRNQQTEKLLEIFYLNFAINQYSLSQMLYGDETFYASKEDQTKRIQIVTATGDTLLVDNEHGVSPTSRVLVVEDLRKRVPDELEEAIAASFNEVYDASDAEGYMLPEFYEKVAAAYGVDSGTDFVLKPVYFSVENGIPQAIKYSVKVLTDELVAEYPHLESYRKLMREKSVDQMVFGSAVKVGSPKAKASLNQDTGRLLPDSFSEDAVLVIDNNNLRFQLNPAGSVDKDVANASQGTAMMNTNGQNTAEIARLHKDNSTIIENGIRKIFRELRLTRKGSMTAGSEKLLREKLKSTLSGLPGGRDVFEMLSAEVEGESASLSLPLIAERVVSTIASMMTSMTTGFRFAGSKLVLQADLGPQKVRTAKGEEVRHLKWRDEEGYCEVILPSEYQDYISVGDVMGVQNGLVGFRIPSTNYHSLLPMKVVGFYPVPEGSKGNVIIAPSLIVYYHGSDYDVDSLFVIRKEKYDKETLDLNQLLTRVDASHENNPDLVIEKGQVVGYPNNEELLVEGKRLQDYLQKYVAKQQALLDSVKLQMVGATPAERRELNSALKVLTDDFDKLTTIVEMSAKNSIVHNFATNMLDMKNRKDLLTPISFEAVVRIKSELKKELEEQLMDKKGELLRKLAASGLIELKC